MRPERAFLYRPLPPLLLVAAPLPTTPPNGRRDESCRRDPGRCASKQLSHPPTIHKPLQRRGARDGASQQDGFDLALDPGRNQRPSYDHQEHPEHRSARQGEQVVG